MAFVLGLDLTCSEQRPTAYAVIDCRPAVVGRGWLNTDEDILEATRRFNPSVVAVDARPGQP